MNKKIILETFREHRPGSKFNFLSKERLENLEESRLLEIGIPASKPYLKYTIKQNINQK